VIADARGIAHVAQARASWALGAARKVHTQISADPNAAVLFQRSYRQVDSANWDSS
jgi:hypothetical protein